MTHPTAASCGDTKDNSGYRDTCSGFRKESEGHDALILKNSANIDGFRGFDTLSINNKLLIFSHKVLGDQVKAF